MFVKRAHTPYFEHSVKIFVFIFFYRVVQIALQYDNIYEEKYRYLQCRLPSAKKEWTISELVV